MAVGTSSITALSKRLEYVRSRIGSCAQRCNRSPDDITLVGVSKTHPAEAIREAISLGLTDFGENRVQEADTKIPVVGRKIAKWHWIGHLQSNKARRAVELFDVIHSLDSASLALRLDRMCEEVNRATLPVLIQVDLGHEATKTGVAEGELPEVVSTVQGCHRLQLTGLMTLPPFFESSEGVRPYFRRLRELRDGLRTSGAFADRRGE